MEKKLQQFKDILAEVDDLDRASAVLSWDQQAFMPRGGAESRGNQMATLNRLSHERFVAKETGKLLEDLETWAKSEDPDSDDARLVKVTRRLFDRKVKVPAEMVTEEAMLTTLGQEAWQEARAKSDFALFRPNLEKLVDFARRYAGLFAPYEHIYDPLLDAYEPGMKTAEVQEIFGGIRPKQVELIHAIAGQTQVDDALLNQHFPEAQQLEFGRDVVTAFGFDWQRGRQDKVTHPFMTNFGFGDQRITVRVNEDFFNPYLFAAMHETGHALYEQGIPKSLERSPIYGGASLGIHESQSRLWENLVGRSKPFWEHFFPRLQQVFPDQFGKARLEDFYPAINRVAPSLIRVEADEATYNLHIMLRLELEIALMEGSLEVKDLPGVWNETFSAYLGITPPDDAQGVLQDVHWSAGLFGYFATYALGNLISAQIWDVVTKALPELDSQVRRGEFAPLLEWLQQNIYRHGAKFETQEMVKKITGSKIDGGPYLRYLNAKFGEIYGL
jgi:carboxypeptidase Taq